MKLAVPGINRVNSLMHPAGFHGVGVERGYFEAWYIKVVSADRSARLAVVPGIYLSPDADGPREAFLQVLDGTTGRRHYQAFDLSDFDASPDHFELRIGPNTFSDQGMHLELADPHLRGDVEFDSRLDAWPVSMVNPGAMGPLAFAPFLETYHGVLSFKHALAGELEFAGQGWDLAGGRGYIEKDWGKRFPAGYLWMQSNHFSDPGTSIMASIALVPWVRGIFRGVLIGLRHEDELYTFSTYTRAKTKSIGIDDTTVRWRIHNRDGATLDIKATRPEGGLRNPPTREHRHHRVDQTLNGTIRVKLTDPDGAVLLEDVGEVAGIEIDGDVSRLLTARDR